MSSPEVQVVDRALLVAHIDIEGEQVKRCDRLAAQHLEQGREAVPIDILPVVHRALHFLRHGCSGCGKLRGWKVRDCVAEGRRMEGIDRRGVGRIRAQKPAAIVVEQQRESE
jgi:hypothetical protein